MKGLMNTQMGAVMIDPGSYCQICRFRSSGVLRYRWNGHGKYERRTGKAPEGR